MRVIACTVLALLLASAPAHAQAQVGQGARVGWDHDRANTTRFEGVIDGQTSSPIAIGMPAANEWTLPAVSAGNHSIQIRACNAAGCSAWSTPALQVQVIVVPAVVTNVRLLPQTINARVTPRAPLASTAPAPVSLPAGVPSVPGALSFQ